MIRSSFILYFFLFVSTAIAQVDYDKLCPTQEVKLKSKLPPVLDQKRMNWCTTFACASGLSYVARTQNPQLPDNFVFSPYDMNLKYNDKRNNLADHASLNKGGNIAELLHSIQSSPDNIKSDKGLPFPFTERDEDLEKLVDTFEKNLEEYIAANPEVDVNLTFNIDPPHKGPNENYSIDKVVAHSRNKGTASGVSVPRENLSISDKLPRTIYSPNYPDEAEVSFSTHMLKGKKDETSYRRYFAKMIDVLGKDTPAYIDTCASQLEKYRYERDNKPLPRSWTDAIREDACGAHQMLAVGVKRNDNGQCVVVLQNSWGSDWDGDGLVEVPFSKIVEFDKKSSGDQKNLTWVEASASPTRINTLYDEDGSEYTGPTKGISPDNGEGRVKNYRIKFVGSEPVTYTGGVKVQTVENAYYVRRHGQGSAESDDGFFERGDFSDGQFVSGLTKKKLSSGSIFEGEFKDSRPHKGTITDAQGIVSDVRNGYIYARRSTSGTHAPNESLAIDTPPEVPSVIETP